MRSITRAVTGGSSGGGTPGGVNQNVQFNNAGAFGGFGTWDGTTLTVNAFAGTGTGLTFPGSLSVAAAKTLTASNTLTLTGTDGITAAFGGGLSIAATKVATISNTLTFAGTDSTTMTFPSTSATIARTDAGNTFTGNQTINESAGGSGLTLTGATQTSSFPVLSATQTWNNAGTTFTAMKLNVTNTASSGTSILFDTQVGGSSVCKIDKWGAITTVDQISGVRITLSHTNNNAVQLSGGIRWSADTVLQRDAASTLALRDGTSTHSLNIYNTFTSSTNFERLMLDWVTTANTAMIYTQKGSGGGTARVLQLNYGGTTTSAISVPITSGAITFGGALTTTGASATIASGTGIPAGGTAGTGYVFSSTANFGVFFGSGAPTLSAAQGSLYLRSDGSSTTTRAYINTDGATTWTAITTAA